jgi:hypothetical protein
MASDGRRFNRRWLADVESAMLGGHVSIAVTREERDFLESGGSLWCIRQVPVGWQAVIKTWESENDVYDTQRAQWQAVRLVYLLFDLSTPQSHFRIHHAISRPEGLWPAYCPPWK